MIKKLLLSVYRSCAGASLLVLVPIIFGGGAAQADISIIPSFAPSTYIDDNRRLRSQGGQDVIATVNRFGLDTRYQRPTYEIGISPAFRLSRYTHETTFNAEDYFLDVNALKVFEHDQLRLAFNFRRENTATTEFDDSGRFDSAVPRTNLGATLSWTHYFRDLSVTTYLGYTDVAFGDMQTGTQNLRDYTYANSGLNLRYPVSVQTTLLANATFSSF